MEKQNLYPILSTVKYNKLGQSVTKVDKYGTKKGSSTINQVLEIDFTKADRNNIDVNPIIHDDDSIIDGLFEKNHMLQARWSVVQQRLEKLRKENDNLTQLLTDERKRNVKYQNKLRYIQENQQVFQKLKNAYISLKYNEHGNRPIVEVKEESCQTVEEYQETEKACIIYQSPEQSLPSAIDNCTNICDCSIEPGYLAVKKNEFNGVKNTVEILKNLIISQPLSTFVLSETREAKYRKDISDLFMENRNLKQMVVDEQLELDEIKQQLALRKSTKESNMLRKIIAKLERQIRSCNICKNKIINEDSATDLNNTEKKIVDHISAKYELKLKQKLVLLDLNTPTTGTPYFTPRSACTEGADTFRSCDDNISLCSF